MSNLYSEKLFSYGTLQYKDVQLRTFGRLLHGKLDILTGYSLSIIEITDPELIKTSGETIHRILNFTGNKTDIVEGKVFAISVEELQQADVYEVDDYKRICVKLLSGTKAWVYVNAKN